MKRIQTDFSLWLQYMPHSHRPTSEEMNQKNIAKQRAQGCDNCYFVYFLLVKMEKEYIQIEKVGSGHARDHMNVGKESFKTRVFDQKKKKTRVYDCCDRDRETRHRIFSSVPLIPFLCLFILTWSNLCFSFVVFLYVHIYISKFSIGFYFSFSYYFLKYNSDFRYIWTILPDRTYTSVEHL